MTVKDQEQEISLLQEGIEPISNTSNNPTFASVLENSVHRRTLFKGGAGAAVASMVSLPLAGCMGSGKLGFDAVPVTDANTVTLPEGYSAKAFIPWGTPITGNYPAYLDGGLNSGEDQEQQVGMHHDGMHFFPIKGSSDHGLLCLNHEYIDQGAMHPNGPTRVDGIRTIADEVRKEVAAHGVSVVEITRNMTGDWYVVPSHLNRRITGATPMKITGPAAGQEKLVTKYSPEGNGARGTLNNCSHGVTPWGTYLTCEENWAGYFRTSQEDRPRELSRYGTGGNSRYQWETVTDEDVYARHDVTPTGASAADDYRNEANTYGWIVEIDPFNPESTPIKHTAFGRFAHEGIVFHKAKEGQPLVAYSGDDARFEYIYKFVSKHPYQKRTAGSWLLDEGTLYVAKFNANGTGKWIALDYNDPEFQAATGDAFSDQGDVLINARTAADMVGATKMDRPEWGAIHPRNGEVYFTLTNNSRRTEGDAANPRSPNYTGHIIRWNEASVDYAGTDFVWDIFMLSGTPEDSQLYPGTLTEDNFHNSPDGLWFDSEGRLWIQTDGADGDPWGNNQMLAANVDDNDVRRFFVGPLDCEVTGVVNTPNNRTMFVNIQHPGVNWPDGGDTRPRSSTVIVTKDDGGVIGT